MTLPPDPVEHRLGDPDADRLAGLAGRLRWSFGHPDSPALPATLPLVRGEIPDEVTLFLDTFRREEPAGAAILRGLRVDDDALGATPDRYDDPNPTEASVTLAFTLLLVGSLLGDPFGMANLQGGRRIHTMVPVAGDETLKSGTSSASTLELHTEDAALAAVGVAPDYLLLLCLRNDDHVPTTYASVRRTQLAGGAAHLLRQPRFTMTTEPDHQASLGPTQRVAVLSGHPDRPDLVYDGGYLSGVDQQAQWALDELTGQLGKVACDLHLDPGDVVAIDNRDAAHGRKPFPRRGNGRDRWYQRCLVMCDPRRSAAWRTSPGSRLIEVHPAG
jgi:hypothetical protein